jgi:hypothetical protein
LSGTVAEDVFGEYGGDPVHFYRRCWERRLFFDDLVGEAFAIVGCLLEVSFPFEFGPSSLLLVEKADASVKEIKPMLKPVKIVGCRCRCMRAWVVY